MWTVLGDDDGDGVPDHLDDDDDNDGIPDAQDNDDDGDGIPDEDEGSFLFTVVLFSCPSFYIQYPRIIFTQSSPLIIAFFFAKCIRLFTLVTY